LQLTVPPRDPATLNKLKNTGKRDTAGKGWFDLPAQVRVPLWVQGLFTVCVLGGTRPGG